MRDYYKGFIHIIDIPECTSYADPLNQKDPVYLTPGWGLRCNFKGNHYGIWRDKGKYPLLSLLILFLLFAWPIKKIEPLEEWVTPPENKTVIFEALK